MNNIIEINNKELQYKQWEGKPVVTFEDIAKVHNVPLETVKTSYKNNKKHFEENKHTYLLKGESLKSFSEQSGFLKTSPSFAVSQRVFTEYGYLLLVKPMRDNVSWQVQELLIENYFRVKETQANVDPIIAMLDTIRSIRNKQLQLEKESTEQKQSINNIQYELDRMHPNITEEDKTAVHIAVELGIYSKSGNPHAQVISAIARRILYNKQDIKVGSYLNYKVRLEQKNHVIYYTPEGRQKIIDYWNKECKGKHKVRIGYKEYNVREK